jgi:hypothetical protein
MLSDSRKCRKAMRGIMIRFQAHIGINRHGKDVSRQGLGTLEDFSPIGRGGWPQRHCAVTDGSGAERLRRAGVTDPADIAEMVDTFVHRLAYEPQRCALFAGQSTRSAIPVISAVAGDFVAESRSG